VWFGRSTDRAAIERGLGLTALSVHALVRAAADLVVLTTGAFSVREEDAVEPVKATLPPLIRTANAEAGRLRARLVDIAPDDPVVAARAVLQATDDAEVAAVRAGRRLVPRLRPATRAGGADDTLTIQPSGLYLITGGLGGIGTEIAGYLLAAYGVSLVLIGRSDIESPEARDKAERLADLAELGDVTYHRADVADAEAVRTAVATAERRSGRRLAGVLHLAGADVRSLWQDIERHTLAREDPAEFGRMFQPKVFGTCALGEVLRDRPDAMLVLASSVNGYFGGSSFGAYAAANGFLHGFAAAWQGPVRCLAWSMWRDVGMNRESPARAAALRRGFREIEPDRGIGLFLEALALPADLVLVGLDDHNPHIARELDPSAYDQVDAIVAYCGTAPVAAVVDVAAPRLSSETTTVRAVPVATIPRNAHGVVDQDRLLQAVLTAANPRTTGYEPPRGDVELTLAQVWQAVLGTPGVGRTDNFFDLGGTSLVAARLIDRMNRTLSVQLSMYQLYEHPTIKDLAKEVETDVGVSAG
jgi:NADP-dependent 3-hydroxy acid dehydrogenase YdfG/acyl carrier protein